MFSEKILLTFPKRSLFPSLGCRVKIIQAGLPYRANAGSGHVLGKNLHSVIRRVVDIARMDADGGTDTGMVREFQIFRNIF